MIETFKHAQIFTFTLFQYDASPTLTKAQTLEQSTNYSNSNQRDIQYIPYNAQTNAVTRASGRDLRYLTSTVVTSTTNTSSYSFIVTSTVTTRRLAYDTS